MFNSYIQFVKNYYLLVCTYFLTLLVSCKHKINPKVENIVNNISETSYVLRDFPEYSYPCDSLIKTSSTEDLIYLTDNKNVVVRYYAFSGLRKRNYPKIKEIYFNHENDFSIINTSNGACLRGSTSVNRLMLESLDPKYFNSKYGFTKNQFEKIRKTLDEK